MKTKIKLLALSLGLITAIAFAAPIDKFDTITTNSPSKLKVDFLKGINFLSTDSVKLPVGTTAQRDAAPTTGMVRINSTNNLPEVYYASAWRNLLTFTTNLSVPVQMDMNSNKIVNLTDPTSAQEAATKNYVDTATAAIDLTNYVDRSTTQSVGGNKTFTGTVTASNPIVGSVTGNAATVTTNANLTGEVTSTGNATTVTNAAVIGKTLTGFTSGAGTVSSSDSLLSAIQKLDGNIASAGSGTITGPIAVSGGVSTVTSQTGTGSKFVMDTSPTLVTPNLGVATATSVNGTVVPSSKTLVVTTDKLNTLAATTSAELAGVISDETGTNKIVYSDSPTLVTPNLGTPSALVGTNITGTAAGLTAGTVTTNANLTGEVVSTGNVATVPTATVINKTLTGYTAAPGTVTSADTILSALQKVDANNATNANLTGEVTSVGNATTVTNAAVIGKVLTGLNSTAGTVTATDTIVGAVGKLNGNAALAIPKTQVTAKGDLIGATASGTPTNIAVGVDGQALIADSGNAKGVSYATINSDLGSLVQFTAKENLANWITGNAATVVPGISTGTMAGTLAKDTTTPINGSASYKYTQAAGSLNDYFCSPAFSVTSKFQGNSVFLSFPLNYNGSSSDLQVSVWDVTGTAAPLSFGTSTNVPAQISSAENIYSLAFPSSITTARICYQVKSLNSGKVFNYADVKISSDAYKTANVNSETNLINAGPITVSATTTNPTKGTTVVDRVMYAKNGQFIKAIYDYQQSAAGSAGSGIYLYSLPAGLQFDTSVITPTTSSPWLSGSNVHRSKVGTAVFKGTGTGIGPGVLYAYSATQFRVVFEYGTGNGSGTAHYMQQTPDGVFDIAAMGFRFDVDAPILGWEAGSSSLVSPVQQVSSDSMTFSYKNAAIVSTDPIGTINTYSYGANSNTAVLCTTAPTQTAASMSANGLQLTAKSYNASSTCANPARIDIYIGKGLKAFNANAWAGLAKTTQIFYGPNFGGTTEFYSTDVRYDETTGQVTLDAGVNGSAIVTRALGMSTGRNSQATGYFTFNAATTPTLAAIKDASVCTGTECIEDFMVEVSAAGALRGNDYNWISGTPTYSAGEWTVNFTAGIFPTQIPVCGATPFDAGASRDVRYYNTTTTSIKVATYGSGGGTQNGFSLHCKKTGQDLKPKTYKMASSIGVPTVPGIVGISTGERVDTFSFSYGTTNATTVCSASPCSYFDQIGNIVTSTTRASTGNYPVGLNKTYTKLKCTGSSYTPTTMSSLTPVNCANCSSFIIGSVNTTNGASVDSYGTLNCQGTY